MSHIQHVVIRGKHSGVGEGAGNENPPLSIYINEIKYKFRAEIDAIEVFVSDEMAIKCL